MRPVLRASAAVIALSSQGAFAASITDPAFGPAPFDSGSVVRIFDFGQTLILNQGELSGARSEGSASTRFRTNQTFGEVGVASTAATGTNAASQVRLFDTLSFDFGTDATSGLVSFSFATEGQISNFNGFQALGTSRIQLADVTGLASPFFVHGLEGGFDPSSTDISINADTSESFPRGESTATFKTPDYLVDERGRFSVTSFDDSGLCTLPIFAFCRNFIDTSDQVFDVGYTLEGSFIAEEGREYALLLSSFASASGGSNPDALVSSDFFGTSTFRFDNLSGVTVFSASGSLPGTRTAEVSPVPLPASLPLMVLALGGMTIVARRRRG